MPIGSAGTVAGILARLAVADTTIGVAAAAVMGTEEEREGFGRELMLYVHLCLLHGHNSASHQGRVKGTIMAVFPVLPQRP